MPEVYNWQLGRKMLYPYEERHPKWQFAFVFNINRCLALPRPVVWRISRPGSSRRGKSTCGGIMWRPSPMAGYCQFYDVKITQLIEQVNPGGQVWNVRVDGSTMPRTGCLKG